MKLEDFLVEHQDLIEKLSAIEHERWAHWQRYVHSNCIENYDGSLTIPRELVKKWEYQMNTEYRYLSEEEKNSDREQVMRYLPLLFPIYKK